MDIGIELNLEKSDLDTFQDRYKENIEKCFTEMLDLWLRTNPRPMLADLIAALKERTVGFHQLAEDLERESGKTVSTMQTSVYARQTLHTNLICRQCSKENMDSFENRKRQRKVGASILLAIAFLIEFLINISAYIHASPMDYDHYATGKGLELAVIGERANTVLYTVYTETVTCELIHKSTCKKLDCRVKKVRDNQYEITYQPTNHGRHQLHIKVEGEHIKGSPFSVSVIRKFGDPIANITMAGHHQCVTVNQHGQIIVAGQGNISIFDSSLKRIRSFKSRESGLGKFHSPGGVAVDGHGNILVTDKTNDCVQKFSPHGRHIAKVGKYGASKLEFKEPLGIAVHPKNSMIYVADSNNHRIQILDPNLKFYNSSRTDEGNEEGQFSVPQGIAFDSCGNVYLTDPLNRRIQVFTPDGELIRWFGRDGGHERRLWFPSAIAIDSHDTVYVSEIFCISLFTTDGKFLTRFRREEIRLNQTTIYPHGIAVDQNGIIYIVSDDRQSSSIKLF